MANNLIHHFLFPIPMFLEELQADIKKARIQLEEALKLIEESANKCRRIQLELIHKQIPPTKN